MKPGRILFSVIFLAGVYLVWHSHKSVSVGDASIEKAKSILSKRELGPDATHTGAPKVARPADSPRVLRPQDLSRFVQQSTPTFAGGGKNFFGPTQKRPSDQVVKERMNDHLFGSTPWAPINPGALVPLDGSYSGLISFDHSETLPWEVFLHLDVKPLSGKYSSQYDVRLIRQGLVISQSQGVGILPAFSSNPNDPDAVIIEVIKDKAYLQLYPMDNLTVLAGNFYMRSNPGKGDLQKQGEVILRR